MIKIVISVWRRPDFTREQFIARWKGEHAALVTKHGQTLRMKRYIQSHRIASPSVDSFASGRGWGAACDGVTEVWWDSEEDMAAGFGSPEGQAASRILQQDEERFVDMKKVTAFMSVEHVVFDYA